jgi:hypothetical protein
MFQQLQGAPTAGASACCESCTYCKPNTLLYQLLLLW